MPSETDTMTYLSQIMELSETIDRQLSISAAVQVLSFEDVTPTIWANLQNAQAESRGLLEMLKAQITESAKIVTNDALVSHLIAVITAD